jgi:hypothetical protein
MEHFNTPILFLVFNRLETTNQVFSEIRELKPKKLFVSCDGPRFENEKGIVLSVRSFILDSIDWDCEVFTNFYDVNLGCKEAVSAGLDWFFSKVDYGIVLEDDCVPSLSFFKFCESMLLKYKDDFRVWHIGGVCNLLENDFIESSTYYFSNYAHIWGWATWANRWKSYNKSITYFELFKSSKFINKITTSLYVRQLWLHSFNFSRLGKVDTWDYQWYYTIWSNGGISILPKVNLVSNIGFGDASTHTKTSNHYLSNRKRYVLDFSEHKDPIFTRVISKYDNKNERLLFGQNFYYLLKTYLFFIFNNLKK